ncbi:MAG: 2-amino-4-hydroxy-6-hydroxymethyldihydropteridine diphosphokinase [Bacillota bacterium]
MAVAYISLGSNQGDRLFYLRSALDLLNQEWALSVTAVSPLYETDPVGGPPQGLFLNACAALCTSFSPASLMLILLAVEEKLGRIRRQQRWTARTLDLDLLIYDDVMMRTPLLELPHPRMTERGFVLVPLAVVAPELIIPGTAKSVWMILEERAPIEGVQLYRDRWFVII